MLRTRAAAKRAAGFTLIELLVVSSILALLVTIAASSLVRVRVAARSFVCKNNLKTVAFEFIQFADDYAHPWRGDSDTDKLPGFYLEDFQERLYGLSEFWKRGPIGAASNNISAQAASVSLAPVPYPDPAQLPMICPSASQELYRRPNLPCREEAVGPTENISIGFNMRLEKVELNRQGRLVAAQVQLTQRILNHPSVPLAFDVAGENAATLKRLPYYSAPSAGTSGKLYANDNFWFPALRHGNELNAAFIGGHVLAAPGKLRPSSGPFPESVDLLRQAGWDWKYQPAAP